MERIKRTLICLECNFETSDSGYFLKHIKKHYSIDEYLDKFKSECEIYCPCCKNQRAYFKGYSKFKTCNCFVIKIKEQKKDEVYKKFTKTRLINKLKKEKLGINNYSLAAFKREKIFKEIILENGETLKQNISKKAGIKISSTLKDKILNGEWMPNTSNRFTHFQWKYKNLKFRSSWEMIFYVLNEQKKLELETIRIKYFNTKKNKECVYIPDFYDKNENIIYEIKPLEFISTQEVIDKEYYALEFCKKNNIKYKFIYQDYFLKNINKIEKLVLEFKCLEKPLKGLKNELKKYNESTCETSKQLLKFYEAQDL